MNLNLSSCAYIALGFASGAAIGYTFGESGNVLANAMITTSCGITRATSALLIDFPLRKQECEALLPNATLLQTEQTNYLRNLKTPSKIFQEANWGFAIGVTLGTVASAPTLCSSLLYGAGVHAVGFLADIVPCCVFGKPLHIDCNEEGQVTKVY